MEKDTQTRWKTQVRTFPEQTIFRIFLTIIILVLLSPPLKAEPEKNNLDFLLFYSGNVQGELEACG